jgi:hypothetical protein
MHLMQASGRTTLTRKASISRTWVGQNSAQMLHPLQYLSMTSIRGLLISGISPLHVDFPQDNDPLKQRDATTTKKGLPVDFGCKNNVFYIASWCMQERKGNVAIALPW